MTSLLLDSKHGQATSGVACHHHLGAAHTVERRWAWNNITSLGQHTRSNNVGRGMPSSPLDSTDGQPTSGVACHHRLWDANTVERRREWHNITPLGLHARSNDVGRCMTLPHLYSAHNWQHRAWHDITALGHHTRSATSGVACH